MHHRVHLTGHHCCQTAMTRFNVPGTVRAQAPITLRFIDRHFLRDRNSGPTFLSVHLVGLQFLGFFCHCKKKAANRLNEKDFLFPRWVSTQACQLRVTKFPLRIISSQNGDHSARNDFCKHFYAFRTRCMCSCVHVCESFMRG